MSDYFERVEAQINRSVAERSRRPGRVPALRVGWLLPVLSTALALVVGAVFLTTRPAATQHTGSRAMPTLLRFQAEPTVQHPVITAALMQLAARDVAHRLEALSLRGVRVHAAGSGEIDVRVPAKVDAGWVARALVSTARLEFYDWEADVLLPSGATVASELPLLNTSAIRISQGAAAAGPGSTPAASLGLYEAVRLAAREPARPPVSPAGYGTTYYMFGAPASAACTAAAAARFLSLAPNQPCLLAGPLTVAPTTTPQTAQHLLQADLPAGYRNVRGKVLAVKQGTTVLEAIPPSFSDWPAFGSTTAGYFAVRNQIAVSGGQISGVHEITSADGQPAIMFGFIDAGAGAFQRLTAAVANRGALENARGGALYQHFAIAVGDQLLTVPYIDFKVYPDGISGTGGADVSGNFTPTTARRLAATLKLPMLPLELELIRAS